jgi:hypothetical protein
MRVKDKAADFNNQQFYIGIDVHLKHWVVTIRSNKMVLRTISMNPEAKELSSYMKRNYPGGEYYSVYEAGFCGYSIHRKLEEIGIKNIIAAPTEITNTRKEYEWSRLPEVSKGIRKWFT